MRKELIHMSDIIKYQPQLPTAIQRQLDRQSHHMTYRAQLTMGALGVQSDIYSAAALKGFQTISALAVLKQMAAKMGMSQETDELFAQLIADCGEAMARIPQRSCEMIYQVLDLASVPQDEAASPGDLLDAFINWLNE
jgi:hypothetical protein